MGGGNMGGRGLLWRSGPVSEAPPMGIRTPQPPPQGPRLRRGLGEGRLGPYAHRRGLRDRTRPPKSASTPHVATTHFAPPGKKHCVLQGLRHDHGKSMAADDPQRSLARQGSVQIPRFVWALGGCILRCAHFPRKVGSMGDPATAGPEMLPDLSQEATTSGPLPRQPAGCSRRSLAIKSGPGTRVLNGRTIEQPREAKASSVL
jgi:hypothetical protein